MVLLPHELLEALVPEGCEAEYTEATAEVQRRRAKWLETALNQRLPVRFRLQA